MIIEGCDHSCSQNADYFNCALKNLLLYVRTTGMPFKSTVLRILIRLLSLPCIDASLLDVRYRLLEGWIVALSQQPFSTTANTWIPRVWFPHRSLF